LLARLAPVYYLLYPVSILSFYVSFKASCGVCNIKQGFQSLLALANSRMADKVV
jgi:hypothetical protein